MNTTRFRHRLRSFLGRHPSLFFPLIGLKQPRGWATVEPGTELIIESFPRSGNTFAYAAFTMVQPETRNVAHHLHVPAQIIRGVKWRIPTLVLIREPVGAVVSLMIREPHLSASQILADYIGFYRRIRPYREGFVVGPFDEVVSDFGRTIHRLNERFGTRFAEFRHTPENVKSCFERIEQMDRFDTGKAQVTETTVARPSRQRDRTKTELRGKLLEDSRLRPRIEQAATLYRQCIGETRPDLLERDTGGSGVD